MTLFVDASALVAIVAEEPGSGVLAASIGDTDQVIWSPMSCWETVSSLCSSHGWPFPAARRAVEDVAALAPFLLVPVGTGELQIALDAYQRYGKRSGHRAKLNMGDCFAYACAKTNDARLLYKGDDFSHTDLA